MDIIDSNPTGRHLCVLGTGLGKTVVFMSTLDLTPGHKTIILAHTDETVRGPAKYIPPGVKYGIEKADERAPDDAQIILASVQSFYRETRLKRYPDSPNISIIIDECHHATTPMYQKILEHFKSAKRVLGFTATPMRSDGVSLDKVFSDILFNKDLVWGIENKWSAPVRCISVDGKYSLAGVEIVAGDYKKDDVERAMLQSNLFKLAAQAYIEHAHNTGRHTIIYTVTKHAGKVLLKEIRSRLPKGEKGKVCILSGDTPIEERHKILSDFAKGKVRAVINCMILTEGFDAPIADCMMNLRPTKSLPLLIQMLGRVVRLMDGKKYALVIDVVPAREKGIKVCTAPSVFGIDEDLLSKEDKKKLLTGKKDILKLKQELVEQMMNHTKVLDMFSSGIEKGFQWFDDILAGIKREGSDCQELARKVREYREYDPSEKEYDFKNMYVSNNPDDEHRYEIRPNYDDIIYIAEPNTMNATTLEFRIKDPQDKDKTVLYKTGCKMSEAIDSAYAYCVIQEERKSYSWNLELREKWKGQPASDKQKYRLGILYKDQEISFDGIDKFSASVLIDAGMRTNELRSLMERFSLPENATTEDKKAMQDALTRYQESETANIRDMSKAFPEFDAGNKKRAAQSLARDAKKNILQRASGQETRGAQSSARADALVTLKGETHLLCKRDQSGSKASATRAQVDLLETLVSDLEKYSCCYIVPQPIDFASLSVRDASVLIQFFKKLRGSLPAERVGKTLLKASDIERSLKESHAITGTCGWVPFNYYIRCSESFVASKDAD